MILYIILKLSIIIYIIVKQLSFPTHNFSISILQILFSEILQGVQHFRLKILIFIPKGGDISYILVYNLHASRPILGIMLLTVRRYLL